MKGRNLKKTYTYATLPAIKLKASAKARKEGVSLSEKIHELLDLYVKNDSFSKETVYFDAMGNFLVQESNKKKK